MSTLNSAPLASPAPTEGVAPIKRDPDGHPAFQLTRRIAREADIEFRGWPRSAAEELIRTLRNVSSDLS